jgi:hypothetical protein
VSLRAGEPRGTSALRALVVVGVAGATMCGWVLVSNGAHTASVGAANCPGCAGAIAATPSARHTTDPATHPTTTDGGEATVVGASVPHPTTSTHTPATTTSTAGLTVFQDLSYSVARAPDGSWLGELLATNPAATPLRDWTLRFTLPDVRLVASDYGTVTRQGDQVVVAGDQARPVPPDGVVRIIIDLAGQPGAPWPTGCQLDQSPCTVATATATPTGDPASWSSR